MLLLHMKLKTILDTYVKRKHRHMVGHNHERLWLNSEPQQGIGTKTSDDIGITHTGIATCSDEV